MSTLTLSTQEVENLLGRPVPDLPAAPIVDSDTDAPRFVFPGVPMSVAEMRLAWPRFFSDGPGDSWVGTEGGHVAEHERWHQAAVGEGWHCLELAATSYTHGDASERFGAQAIPTVATLCYAGLLHQLAYRRPLFDLHLASAWSQELDGYGDDANDVYMCVLFHPEQQMSLRSYPDTPGTSLRTITLR